MSKAFPVVESVIWRLASHESVHTSPEAAELRGMIFRAQAALSPLIDRHTQD